MTIKKIGSDELDKAIKQLKQGLLSNNLPIIRKAYKRLHDIGPDVCPRLLAELKQIDVRKVDRPEVVMMARGLAIILHDLNEDISREFIANAMALKISPLIKSAFNGILHFRRDNFREVQFNGILILEDKSIDKEYHASSHVLRWLKIIPLKHLEGIPRIYIIKDDTDFDFRGYIETYLSVIVIAWETDWQPKNILQKLSRFAQKKTLYHEIGHHFHQHTDGGQVPEQEEEAYARKMIRKAHPRLSKFAKVVKLIFPKKRNRQKVNNYNQGLVWWCKKLYYYNRSILIIQILE